MMAPGTDDVPMNDEMRADCIIVAGMHRSGTSMVAGLLAASGVDMGRHLVPPDRGNPEGYHEDLDIVRFHQGAFHHVLRPHAGHIDWGWTEVDAIDAGRMTAWTRRASQLVRGRMAAGRPWGFKDPRVTPILDFWDALLGTPQYVGVYRNPVAVADSIQRIAANSDLGDPRYAWALWHFYNQRLLTFTRRHRGRVLLVNVDGLVASPGAFAEVARRRLGLEVSDAALRGRIRPDSLTSADTLAARERLARHVWADAYALYGELEALADLPAGDRGRPRVAQRAEAPEGPAARWDEVSIIIPTHNDAPFLVEALASVAASTSGACEVLVLDDGTTDRESLRILDRLRATGQRVLRQERRGLAEARNRLVAESRGRFLLPLDADNRLVPGFVERAMEAFRHDPGLGVVYGDRRLFGLQQGDVTVPEPRLDRLVNVNTIDACAMYRRELWADVGGYDVTFCFEDWEFWLHAMKRGWRFRHLPGIAFEYRVRSRSLVTRGMHPRHRLRFRRRLVRKHADLLLSLMPTAMRALAGTRPGLRQQLVMVPYWFHIWERRPWKTGPS